MVRSNSNKAKEDEIDNINPIILRLAFRGKISTYDVPIDSLQALIFDALAVQKDDELFATDKCREYAQKLRDLANL